MVWCGSIVRLEALARLASMHLRLRIRTDVIRLHGLIDRSIGTWYAAIALSNNLAGYFYSHKARRILS